MNQQSLRGGRRFASSESPGPWAIRHAARTARFVSIGYDGAEVSGIGLVGDPVACSAGICGWGVTRIGRGWLREPPSGLAESWTTVDGHAVRSLHAGRLTDYPEVVILPGLGAPFYVAPWAEQIAGWTGVVVLDLPGWRGGRAQSSPPSIAGIAEATAGWLTETDRHDVVLAGHSSGAQSALRAARLVPERLRGVVLAGPTLAPEARRALPLLRRVVATLVKEELPELPAVTPSYVASGGLALMRLVRSIMRDRPEDAATGLVPPVLVMTGERDRVAPPQWAQHLAHLSDAAYVVLPGAHNTCFTFPRNTNLALQQTITKWAAATEEPPAPRD